MGPTGTPHVLALLDRAAASDVAIARGAVTARSDLRLLELVAAHATWASTAERPRSAGVDALAAADRATQELVGPGGRLRRSAPGAGDDVLGWELATCDDARELVGATLSLDVRPWVQVLVAFAAPSRPAGPAHRNAPAGIGARGRDGDLRRVTAVAVDGRVVSLTLRLDERATPGRPSVVLGATVSDRWEDHGPDPSLAWGLANALVRARPTSASRGR